LFFRLDDPGRLAVHVQEVVGKLPAPSLALPRTSGGGDSEERELTDGYAGRAVDVHVRDAAHLPASGPKEIVDRCSGNLFGFAHAVPSGVSCRNQRLSRVTNERGNRVPAAQDATDAVPVHHVLQPGAALRGALHCRPSILCASEFPHSLLRYTPRVKQRVPPLAQNRRGQQAAYALPIPRTLLHGSSLSGTPIVRISTSEGPSPRETRSWQGVGLPAQHPAAT